MFSDEQKKELSGKLDPKNVSQREKGGTRLSYIEGWFTEDEANRIFGFDGWDSILLDLRENCAPTQNAKSNWVVSFRATVRVKAGGVERDGVGFGSGIARDIHDAYEGAIKEAATDAEKRALKTFGNKFGLALYDKQQANVGYDPVSPEEMKLILDEINNSNSPNDFNAAKEKATIAKPRMSDDQKLKVADAIKARVAALEIPPLKTAQTNGAYHA